MQPARTASRPRAGSVLLDRPRLRPVGITVYGCRRDEADAFNALSPRSGVVPTITSAAVSDLIPEPGNRCISVSHRSEVSHRTLRALKDAGVEYISTRSIGTDHIDLVAADRLGITVENVVYAPDGVADYTLMLMLMVIRHARHTVIATGRGDFGRARVRGRELRDMTVGVVGAGHIGTAVIERLRGFGCRVLAHGNRVDPVLAALRVPLDNLLRDSDVVTLHLPLNADTRHLISAERIGRMRDGAFLVNTGRGALVDTGALIEALERGKLAGAGLDVLEGEEAHFHPDRAARPRRHQLLQRLQRHPNVVITPHTAYYTERALYDTVEKTLLNCVRFERSRAGD